MFEYLKTIEKRMNDDDKAQLKSIFAPVFVTKPLEFAAETLTLMRDGEIRLYGKIGQKNYMDKGIRAYNSSMDSGLSWKKHIVNNKRVFGKGQYVEELDMWIRLINTETKDIPQPDFEIEKGTYIISTKDGPDSENIKWVKISDELYHWCRNFIVTKSGRLIGTTEIARFIGDKHLYNCACIYSDDNGTTWTINDIEAPPEFPIQKGHQGLRWQNHACEPVIFEKQDGTFQIICRTSHNFHYSYISNDNGTTWSKPFPTDFHATLTMPEMTRMSDGRLIFMWCNTQPLPELDHKKACPPLGNDIDKGIWEDVFTNRDANHAAISDDDGKTWKGFREIILNPIRNNCDFRSYGGIEEILDKSVHQFEGFELPFGKIMMICGQHKACQSVMIFDPDWLLETEKVEDFRHGLSGVSTQTYIKSNLGAYRNFSGHCSYNRTNGAILAQDPTGNFEEALLISRIENPNLVSEVQGMTWNFPASLRGELHIKMYVKGFGVRISLTDRWFNPIDVAIKEDAAITFIADKDFLRNDNKIWTDVNIKWDINKSEYSIYINEKLIKTDKIAIAVPNGFSYVHIHGVAKCKDFDGTYIKYLKKSDNAVK